MNSFHFWRILNQSTCMKYELYKYEKDSELCGGQILQPRTFIQVKYNKISKHFVDNGFETEEDKEIAIGGVDACQVKIFQF